MVALIAARFRKYYNSQNLGMSYINSIGTLIDQGFYEQFGEGSTFPQVVLNGDNLGGCTETVQYLKENNLV